MGIRFSGKISRLLATRFLAPTTVYAEGVRNTSIERITKLVKIVGMFLQSKVYLFEAVARLREKLGYAELNGKPE